ncbi:hypothetical protein F4779DRAFT_616263 [Xylariaceae sp. FL0662B]|nr:hypothetical protein F4779DRAFT_616263 [Xylariaceae sp. FL0662B]
MARSVFVVLLSLFAYRVSASPISSNNGIESSPTAVDSTPMAFDSTPTAFESTPTGDSPVVLVTDSPSITDGPVSDQQWSSPWSSPVWPTWSNGSSWGPWPSPTWSSWSSSRVFPNVTGSRTWSSRWPEETEMSEDNVKADDVVEVAGDVAEEAESSS